VTVLCVDMWLARHSHELTIYRLYVPILARRQPRLFYHHHANIYAYPSYPDANFDQQLASLHKAAGQAAVAAGHPEPSLLARSHGAYTVLGRPGSTPAAAMPESRTASNTTRCIVIV